MVVSHLCDVGPAWMRRIIVAAVPNARVKRLKDIVDTMYARSVGIMEGKKRAVQHGDSELMEQIGEGKDVMSILRTFLSGYVIVSADRALVRANMGADAKEKLSDDEIVAQMSYVRIGSLGFAKHSSLARPALSSLRGRIQRRMSPHVSCISLLRGPTRRKSFAQKSSAHRSPTSLTTTN